MDMIVEKGKEKVKETTDTVKDYLIITAVSICGTILGTELFKGIGWIYDEHKDKKLKKLKYPDITPSKVHLLFSQLTKTKFKAPRYEVINKEMSEVMKQALERAKDNDGIVLLNGPTGIGKTTTLQRVLNETQYDFIYYSFKHSLTELTNILIPETLYHEEIRDFRLLAKSLLDYGTFRDTTKLTGHALVVLDNIEKLEPVDQIALKEMAKCLIDERAPISFILISSDKEPLTVFSKDLNHLTVKRLIEPSSNVANEFLRTAGVNNDYFTDVKKVTGTSFRYLIETLPIRKGLSKDSFITELKEAVYQKINDQIGEYLDDSRFPEIIEVCQNLIQGKTVTSSEYWKRTENNQKDDIKFRHHWSYQFLKKPLLKIQDKRVEFEDTATMVFVKNYISTK